MKQIASAAIAGGLFGIGLAVSGMTNPAVVRGFLDVTGAWNPALALVMGGALLVTLPGMAWMKRRRPLFDDQCHWPQSTVIDSPLIIGAVLFGIGWGLSGLCPGPAFAGVALASSEVGLFVLAMLAGMWAFSVYKRLRG